jgi:DNA-binding transcriptional MocR family regulator
MNADDRSSASEAYEADGASISRLVGADNTLSAQLAARLALRMDEHALKPGTRLPSIRAYAAQQRVSRSTVIEAYDRLIAVGLIESRRASGFYVAARSRSGTRRTQAAGEQAPAVDAGAPNVVWLLRSMLRQAPASHQPGAGLLPTEWLDADLVGAAVRAVGRTMSSQLAYGLPEGYLPLREQIVHRLALADVGAAPAQIVTTSGVTQGIDLVARHFVATGDTVFVEDPAWFVMFARFAAFGARVIGVPRRADGPDIKVLRNLLTRHQPKLFVIGSVLHNPTSTSASAAIAHQLLKLADEYGFTIVEDDIYGDLHPGRSAGAAVRLASLDQLRRVVYVSGFSKSLAANLRVGYVACASELAEQLANLKLLTGLTTPEVTERVVARVLSEGGYRRHLERLRSKLDAARDRTARSLERMGAKLFAPPDAGMFLWADFGRETNSIAAAGAQQDILCAPGSLFSPTQLPSPWMRVSVAACLNPAAMKFLAQAVQR